MPIGKKERENRELVENAEVMEDYHSRPRSLSPKAGQKSSIHSKTDDKYYGKGKSMSERFRNFVTGGAQGALDKAAGK